ncbi:hypothetical protein F511_37470 [Dorcoceras hygrometricum]|uniref:Uncharacterized protein n=1 Tax=Dorcoceras hygrometricum TaxID=472368 RepID=A0A2Z7AD59_9LAMI|nr:hypothetical protein F511_37470 [Dorcoceras hygrometricum]
MSPETRWSIDGASPERRPAGDRHHENSCGARARARRTGAHIIAQPAATSRPRRTRTRDHRPASIAHRVAQGSTHRPTCATSAQPICARRWPSIGHDARRARMQSCCSRAASARPRAVHRAAGARWRRARSATISDGRALEARASVREEGAVASGGGRPRSKASNFG